MPIVANANATLAILDPVIAKQPTDLAGTTALVEVPIFRNMQNGQITIESVSYQGRAVATGSDTNNFSIVVRRRDVAGGAPVIVVTYVNNVVSGGLLAFVTKSLGTLANTVLAVGQSLTMQVTKLGTGQTFPAGNLYVTYRVG